MGGKVGEVDLRLFFNLIFNTLYSYNKDDKSKKYSAVVKYFDGENLISDGYFTPAHYDCFCCDDDSGRHLTYFVLDKEPREAVIDML